MLFHEVFLRGFMFGKTSCVGLLRGTLGHEGMHSAEEALTILRKLNRDFGKTVIMVTHDPKASTYATVTRHLDKGAMLP